MQGAGFRVQGSGFRVQGSGFRVQGSGFRVQGSGFRVQGSGFRAISHRPECRPGVPRQSLGGGKFTQRLLKTAALRRKLTFGDPAW